MYEELAGWFHLLTAPAEYEQEATLYRDVLHRAGGDAIKSVLELGCGGGNNASHLKAWFELTLTDLSPEMLELSRSINPQCRHVLGDMRTLRLNETFDAVFLHDAVTYMTTEQDLFDALRTMAAHLRPGGVGLVVPDHTTENFRESNHGGGHSDSARGLRYLEWTYDPDPTDTQAETDFAIFLRDGNEPVRMVHDHHTIGVFPRATWLRLMDEAGFDAQVAPSGQWDSGPENPELFVGVRRGQGQGQG
jgi:SAM-dependent methyltransferase